MRAFGWLAIGALACGAAAWADEAVVSIVRAAQRNDGSKIVDVYYDLSGAVGPVAINVLFSDNNGVNWNVTPSSGALSGDVGPGITNGTNRHIVWNAVLDRPNAHWVNARAKVSASSSAGTTTITLPGGVLLEMVTIPAGSFTMGSTEGSDEQPTHTVTITQPFLMGKYEVTQAQWQAVMGANPSYFTGNPNRPVDNVSWNDCQAFIAAINALEQGTFRLPSEAEWEYACRAGTTTKWSFGDNDELLVDYAWYSGNSLDISHAVGQKLPNAWGLYDMHGNLWEWCQDRYGEYTADAELDPQGPSTGMSRVLRGGGWDCYSWNCRSSYRIFDNPDDRNNVCGLRLCAPVPSRK